MLTQEVWTSTRDCLGSVKRFVGLGLFCLVLASAGVIPAEAAEAPPPASAKRLPRMYDGAPPQIPHSIAGLEGLCLGCHLEGAEGAPIVPHPDRPNCRQCHITQDPSVKPFVKNTFSGKPIPPPK